MKRIGWLLSLCVIGPALVADAQQAPAPATSEVSSRSTTAVTYEARRSTKVDMIGTPLMPRARGEVEVQTEASGPVRIKAKLKDVARPDPLGPEYLTFVLWAVPPQGRAKNLGELRLDDGAAEIEATADVQTFALIVTAEPYYAVTTPSDTVVIENAIRQETRGRTSVAALRYEIVPRGAYVAGGGANYGRPQAGKNEPPDVQQARNALAIARIADAGRYAPDSLATAQQLLSQVDKLVASKGDKRQIVSEARASVQAAEESRLQSVGRRAAAEQQAARTAAAAREQAARDAAAKEAAGRQAAVEDRQRAEAAAQEAVRERAQAEQARQEALKQQERAQQAALEAKRERELADQSRQEAERLRALAQADATKAQADATKAQADAAQAQTAAAQAKADTAQAQALRARAEQDQAELRATLLKQLGAILETRDTARGLIVNVGDVLFETGRYELLPAAREKLARFAGIVLGHPELMVQVEGFTDSTGTAALNEQLSQRRAGSVSDYLVAQSLSAGRLSARGYGAGNPVASNDTAEGRRQNRRVELVVSGDVIGTPIAAAVR